MINHRHRSKDRFKRNVVRNPGEGSGDLWVHRRFRCRLKEGFGATDVLTPFGVSALQTLMVTGVSAELQRWRHTILCETRANQSVSVLRSVFVRKRDPQSAGSRRAKKAPS